MFNNNYNKVEHSGNSKESDTQKVNSSVESFSLKPMTDPKSSSAQNVNVEESRVNVLEFDDPREEADKIDCCAMFITIVVTFFSLLLFPFTIWFMFRIVTQYERGVVFRLGRTNRKTLKRPGLAFIIPCIDTLRKVDLRTVTYDVPPQEILTKDSVTVAVDAVVYYRIFDPMTAVTNVEDYNKSTRLLAQTTLRNVLGTKDLAQLLSEREVISNMIQDSLDKATDVWGIKVERVEVKDCRLPISMQRAMAAEAEASREAQAKIITAEGEQKASRALKEASDVMAESPFTLQLRFLQTLGTISAEKNSTIVFPLPIEMLSAFKNMGKEKTN